ncbi:GFA family protein [Henriciella barbarensis]|nr:hypothetical protein [Henriciella barbarensis]
MTANCLCGAVHITIAAKPDFIFDCNCSLCRKTGAAWGYFKPESVSAKGETIGYARSDKALAAVDVHSCTACGATTHWVRTDEFRNQHQVNDMVGVNMRLFDPDQLDGVPVQFPDGKNWMGEGAFDFRREGLTIGVDARW